MLGIWRSPSSFAITSALPSYNVINEWNKLTAGAVPTTLVNAIELYALPNEIPMANRPEFTSSSLIWSRCVNILVRKKRMKDC